MLASWICAIHGIDPQEMGIRLNQAQNVLNENNEAKIAYSKDRGLKSLLGFHTSWLTNIIERVPEWKDYRVEFTGLESKSQMSMLEVDDTGTVETVFEEDQ